MTIPPTFPGRLELCDGAKEVAETASRELAAALIRGLSERGRVALGLSGGNTPRSAYALLAKAPGILWRDVDVFWVDERAVPQNDDRSNFRHANEMLINPAEIPHEHVHRMKGEMRDLEAAARSYEREIAEVVPTDGAGLPAFDVLVLGVGDDGHTASLFPGEPAVSVTERVVLAIPAKGEREARLTLSAPVIKAAKRIFVLATGASKKGPLAKAWDGKGDPVATPIRIVRNAFGEVVWVVDRAAAGR